MCVNFPIFKKCENFLREIVSKYSCVQVVWQTGRWQEGKFVARCSHLPAASHPPTRCNHWGGWPPWWRGCGRWCCHQQPRGGWPVTMMKTVWKMMLPSTCLIWWMGLLLFAFILLSGESYSSKEFSMLRVEILFSLRYRQSIRIRKISPIYQPMKAPDNESAIFGQNKAFWGF